MPELKDLNPGSPSAIRKGCTCPVLDNNHGNGAFGTKENPDTMFWYDSGCPLHGDKRND